MKKATDLAIELLSIHPDRKHAANNLRRLDAAVKYGTEKVRWPEKVQAPPTSTLNAEQQELYHKACRDDGPAPVEIGSRLRCRYYDAGGNPFLLIGPLREEEANLDPRIVLYRDFLRDGEISTIKHIARPRVSWVYLVLFFFEIFFFSITYLHKTKSRSMTLVGYCVENFLTVCGRTWCPPSLVWTCIGR